MSRMIRTPPPCPDHAKDSTGHCWLNEECPRYVGICQVHGGETSSTTDPVFCSLSYIIPISEWGSWVPDNDAVPSPRVRGYWLW